MPFVKGRSGNPAGRKPGATTTAQRLRAGLERHVPGILDALVQQAMGGDVQAAKLVLERTIPPLKPVEVPVPVPLGADLGTAIPAILAALSAGQIAPGQGANLLGAAATAARGLVAAELEQRIARLEAQQHVEAAGEGSPTGGRTDPAEGQGDEHRGVAGLGGGCAVDARPDG